MLRQRYITKNLFACLAVALFLLSFLLTLIESMRRIDLPSVSWPENTLFGFDNCLWIFLFMGFVYFLLKNEFIFALMFAFLASFCRYESIPCIFVFLILYYYFFKENRAFAIKILKFYLIFTIFFTAYTIILCLMQGGGIKYLSELLYDKILIRFDVARSIIQKNFNFITTEERIRGYFNWPNTRLFIETAILSTYFFLILFLIPSGDKITRLVSAFGIIFFIAVAGQSFKLINYALLLIPFSAINLRRFIYPTINVKLFFCLSYMTIWFICKYLISYH